MEMRKRSMFHSCACLQVWKPIPVSTDVETGNQVQEWYRPLYTHPFNCPFSGTTRWAGTRKVKPIWILRKQETMSGSGISWAICKSTSRSRLITMPAPHCSVFYRPDALPAAQPTESKHWRLLQTSVHRVNWHHRICGHDTITIL